MAGTAGGARLPRMPSGQGIKATAAALRPHPGSAVASWNILVWVPL